VLWRGGGGVVMVGVKYIGPVNDFCYDEKTEVLTDKGWMFFKDLLGDERFASLDKTGTLYYTPANNAEPIKIRWEDDLLRFKSTRSGVDLLVTPNHSMYVQTEKSRKKGNGLGWKLQPAKQVFKKHRYYKRNASRYEKVGPEKINVCGRDILTEDWLWFLGFYLF